MQQEISVINIIFENEDFAILNKKRGLPTAPLKMGDTSLVTSFLKSRDLKEQVIGKKAIEAGLLHRLDTATSGLVLIAKKQKIYDTLQNMQKAHLIKKEYIAFCDYVPATFHIPIVQIEHNNSLYSFNIESSFVPFGKRGHKVKALIDSNEHLQFKENAKKKYKTYILIEQSNCIKEIKNYTNRRIIYEDKKHLKGWATCRCILTQGYRHQVRCHLASVGLPIKGDALYNTKYIAKCTQKRIESEKKANSYPLELYAVKLTFPSPYSQDKILSFSLPPLNKKNQ